MILSLALLIAAVAFLVLFLWGGFTLPHRAHLITLHVAFWGGGAGFIICLILAGHFLVWSIWWLPLAAYGAGLIITLAVNLGGPIEAPLALVRAVVWPYWWMTGRPDGVRRVMD